MKSLPLFHRIAGRKIVVVGDGEEAEAKRRFVERAGGIPCSEAEAHQARIAFVGLEDERAAKAAARRLRELGLLVNVVDRPALCDFTTPSVLDRDPVLIAIGTGGASAGLAKHIRLRLEALLPPTLGRLADALFAAREALRERFPGGAERRRALDEALGEGGALDPMDADSVDRVEEWLEAVETLKSREEVEIILRSDDPDDLTLRQARLLGMADLVLFDPDVPAAVLARIRADATRRPLDETHDVVEPRDGLTVRLKRRT